MASQVLSGEGYRSSWLPASSLISGGGARIGILRWPSDALITDSLRGIVPSDAGLDEYREYLVEKYDAE